MRLLPSVKSVLMPATRPTPSWPLSNPRKVACGLRHTAGQDGIPLCSPPGRYAATLVRCYAATLTGTQSARRILGEGVGSLVDVERYSARSAGRRPASEAGSKHEAPRWNSG